MRIVLGGDFNCALAPLEPLLRENRQLLTKSKTCARISTSKMCGDYSTLEHYNTHGAITR